MNRLFSKSKVASLIATLALTPLCAFNGLTPIGYGVKAEALAGAVTANPQDSLIVFSNPAGLGFLDNTFDIGLSARNYPDNYFTYSNTYLGGPGRLDAKDTIFVMPSMGMNKSIKENQKIGLGLYSCNYETSYSQPYPAFGFTAQSLSIDQTLLGCGWSYTINEQHSFGVTLLGSLLKVNCKGLEKLDAFSDKEGHVTNNGGEYSLGAGLRFGWLSCFFDHLWAGVSFSTKIYQQPLHKYNGFINCGRLNIPSNATASIRYQINDRMNFAVEYQIVFNQGVRFLGNPVDDFLIGTFGDKNNIGMGWRNQSSGKISYDYQLNDLWQIKLGAVVQQPLYSKKEMDYNTMTLGVIDYWITSGLKYQIDDIREINLSYVRGLKNEKEGRSYFGYGAMTEVSSENILGISFSQKF
ncbi:MAG: outer membrane protein transport protein [Parachlamydiales bacterium]|nr:outer membrane protein transport protein [Parachlamydiales bacterium]